MDKILNSFIDNLALFVDELSEKYRYDNNIRHLLYLVIPSFVSYYGFGKVKIIKEIFENVPIFLFDAKDGVFAKYEKYINDNKISARILVSNINNNAISDTVDQLIHEYNHAINSYYNAFIDGKMRTGISFSSNGVSDNRYILEETINTYQTEKIIEYIKNFDENAIKNKEVANTIYNLKHDHYGRFKSKAYHLYTELLKDFFKINSLMLTLEDNRFYGDIDSFISYFDLVLYKGSFDILNTKLSLLDINIKEYERRKIFKKKKLFKIRTLAREIINLINDFNKNSIY